MSLQQQAQEQIDNVLALIHEKLHKDQASKVVIFAKCYLNSVSAEDLMGQDLMNLYGAIVSHWRFVMQRKAKTARVKVYNPNLEEHGWQSSHTTLLIINADMPFLVDSIRMALNRRGMTVHLIIYPVIEVKRDGKGDLLDILFPRDDKKTANGIRESFIHVETDRQTEKKIIQELTNDIEHVLHEVQSAVDDWQKMKDQMTQVIAQTSNQSLPIEQEQRNEDLAFLQWLNNDNFTFLGFREYDLVKQDDSVNLYRVVDSGLGILRDKGERAISQSFSSLPPELRKTVLKPSLIIITRSTYQSVIHRSGYMTYIGIRIFNADGSIKGEYRFLGLFTSAAYNRSVSDIPLLGRKVKYILARSSYPSAGHSGKALLHIMETYPRDEFFQIPEEALFDTILGIFHLQERQRIRVFIHVDSYIRFVSCIVYIPRERYNTEIRQKMEVVLQNCFKCEDSEFFVTLSESILARIYFIIRLKPGNTLEYDKAEIERQIIDVTHNWEDEMSQALIEKEGEESGTRLFRKYRAAFPVAYRDYFLPRHVVADILHLETLDNGLGMGLYRPIEAPAGIFRFKLFSERQLMLSETLPMLENMGVKVVDEHPYEIKLANQSVWIQDFGLMHNEPEDLETDKFKDLFQNAFARVWHGDAENDGFNRLVLRKGVAWREISVLRAYCKYLLQIGSTFSQSYIEETVVNNARIAELLLALFHARFSPKKNSSTLPRIVAKIEASLDEVASLDEDRILRSFLGVIMATIRTNYYKFDENKNFKNYLSFKFQSAKVPELPEPRPHFEIFVYSTRIEGIHLRGGNVARGGLRWSDRREDFRTEVLGLMKAQMTKNSVIVPVGAKGGFVAKLLTANMDSKHQLTEVQECYRTFIRGLLDLTDNYVNGVVVPPKGVVCHDQNDSYLVVAADKGTATFSDIANEIANEYEFWLGDAFASGGATGYDHKKMGITARGAWESVKRHFRELGHNIEQIPFNVIGIGDMSGDVFGNGMLLSSKIKLVAAFNHSHIFFDPDPDPEKSFKERLRLFSLPRSSWEDYSSALISKGGGVFQRTKKSISLSAEIQSMLGVTQRAMPPNELIQAILKAPVDLFWNGGIGTYVKASEQRHADVEDRSNDGVRVDANDLRCRVVVEGGNLGFTQKARIQYALSGGRIYTDTIDNAGGVNCSDHEVNIKILLNDLVTAGELTEKQRVELLSSMTTDIAKMVLHDNRFQALAISLASIEAKSMLDGVMRFMNHLEKTGHLDRAIEFLPSNKDIANRKTERVWITAPEEAVLLAYSKITLYQELLATDLPDDPALQTELMAYFPKLLVERFENQIDKHRLKREIISTRVANAIVNYAGSTAVFRLKEETGAAVADIAKVYMASLEIFALDQLWLELENLDNDIATEVQINLFLEVRRFIERVTRTLVLNHNLPLNFLALIKRYKHDITVLRDQIVGFTKESHCQQIDKKKVRYLQNGIPQALAEQVALLDIMICSVDIVDVSKKTELNTEIVARTFFALAECLHLRWIRKQIEKLPRDNRWNALSRFALRDELQQHHRGLTTIVLHKFNQKTDINIHINQWIEKNKRIIEHCQNLVYDIKNSSNLELSMLSSVMREIRYLLNRNTVTQIEA